MERLDMMKCQNTQKEDTRYITLLSVISCFAVVLLHTNGCFWNFSSTERYWKTANIIESVCYFAVPIFFMVSGATLIDYSDRYSTKIFFKKRIKKTVIPFLVWSLIGIAFSCLFLKTVDIAAIGKKYIINSIFNASVVTHYWFFPPLFCVYLCMPLFTAVEKSKRRSTFLYLVFAGYFINTFIPFVKNLLSVDVSFPFSVYVISNNLLFTTTGYLLSHYEYTRKQKKCVYVMAGIALLAHIVGTYVVSMNAGTSMRTFKNIAISLPYASGIFLLVKTYGNKLMDGMIEKAVNFLKKYTFSIYLLHWFVLKTLNYLCPFDTRSIVYRLGMPFVVIPICIVLTMILRKVPIVKHLVPQ